MTVKAQEFGEAKANINNLMQTMAAHITRTEKAIERIDKRIDDHMNKEEAEREEMIRLMKIHAEASQARHDAAQKATLERFALLEAGYNQAKIEKSVRDQYNKIFFVIAGTAVSTIGGVVFFLMRIGVMYFFPDSVVAETISKLYSLHSLI